MIKILIFLVVIASLSMGGFMEFRLSSEEVTERFEKVNLEIKEGRKIYKGRKIRFFQTGELKDSDQVILFIHGAPGSSQDYLQFLEDKQLRKEFCLMAVDRPGYGYSGFGHSMSSIEEQARSIFTLIEGIPREKKIILVGHSFGGPIVAKMASLFPNEIDVIIMLAPALDPREERFIPLAKFSKIPPIRWLTPYPFRVAADEKTAHVAELKKMDPDWASIKCQVIHVHGTKDSLVPYENILITREKMTSARVQAITLEGADHFLPWSHTELVKDLLLNLEDRAIN